LPGNEVHRFENPSQTAAIWRKTPEPAGFFLFGNPVIADTLELLPHLESAFPQAPAVGGVCAGGPGPEDVFVFTEDVIARSGTLLVSLTDPIRMVPLVSQGCRPIGEPFVVTGSESENILTIGI
jgi:small ligand-binding sensory domain FIST